MIKVVVVEDKSECREQIVAYLDRYAAENALDIEKEIYSDGWILQATTALTGTWSCWT